MELAAGEHTFHVYDSYCDGWHGGAYQLLDGAGQAITGRIPVSEAMTPGTPSSGQRTACGSSAPFTTAAAGSVTVRVWISTYGEEVSWFINRNSGGTSWDAAGGANEEYRAYNARSYVGPMTPHRLRRHRRRHRRFDLEVSTVIKGRIFYGARSHLLCSFAFSRVVGRLTADYV